MKKDDNSGFIIEDMEPQQAGFTDIELIARTQVNVMYRAQRKGQWWLLKGLAPDKVGETFFEEMLTKESELLLRAQTPGHPAIVKALGIEEIADEALDIFPSRHARFIVMEWVEGQTLKDFLEKGPTGKERQRVADQLIDALAYLHSINIVHRDLKPSNIMVTRNGQNVKLIDFGLADADFFSVLKQSCGTEGYISPEQRKGAQPDVRNDIYSLGVIMKEMELDEGSLAIADRCIQPIDRRYHNIGEVKDAFLQVHNSVSVGGNLRFPNRRTLLFLPLSLLLLALVGGGLWYWYTHKPVAQIFQDMTAWTYTEPQCFKVTNEGAKNTIAFTGMEDVEPACCPIYVKTGRRYRVSVDYSGDGYVRDDRGDAGFQVMVREGLPRRKRNNSGVMASERIPDYKVKDYRLTVDFTATNDIMYVRINFGWVKDSIPYKFHFDNWTLEPLPDMEGSSVYTQGSMKLYNEASNLYLRPSGYNGSQASLGEKGMKLDLTACGKGYLIDTHEYDPGDGVEERFLNFYDVIVGTWAWINVNAQVWYFQKQPDGCYKMCNDSQLYLTYDGKERTLKMLPDDKTSNRNHWKVVRYP